LPGLQSLLFLAFLLLLLPSAAIRSARRLRMAGTEGTPRPVPSRVRVWSSSLALQGMLLLAAWYTGRGFDYRIFHASAIGAAEIGAAVATLGILFLLRARIRARRPAEERKNLAVYRLSPRTPLEWTLWTATVLVASVAEEAAYRGVGMSILWYSLGNPWLAAPICAAAFALAHAVQGWRSMVAIFQIGLLMHALVAVAGTLVLAMAVHAAYDCVAGVLIARENGA